MIKLRLFSFILLASTALAGCAVPDTAQAETTVVTAASADDSAGPGAALQNSAGAETAASETAASQAPADPLENLTLNEYDGLEMTAAILPRKAILPGSTVPVTVVIANKGDKTISYVQGSGSFSTPQALSFSFAGLQPILPEDHLGIATMDFVVKEIKPGETLTFVLNVKVIEPHADFDTYTYDLFNSKQVYIGALDPQALTEQFPELIPAKAGAYEGNAVFKYRIVEEGLDSARISNASGFSLDSITGYNLAPVTVSVVD